MNEKLEAVSVSIPHPKYSLTAPLENMSQGMLSAKEKNANTQAWLDKRENQGYYVSIYLTGKKTDFHMLFIDEIQKIIIKYIFLENLLIYSWK